MVKKGDFIEVEFTGKVKDGGIVFDTNVESVAKDSGIDKKGLKPFVLAVGQRMLPEGFDEDLIGKELGKDYVVEIEPEKAFGKRNSEMVRMIPTKHFIEQQINPVRGMQLNLDGQLVRILSSDRGRTLVDFNHPLAGKRVVYDYKILREVSDEKEKIDAVQDFFFRRIFDYEVKDKKVVFKVEKNFEPFIKMISPKFEEILGLKVDVEVVEKKKEDKKKVEESEKVEEKIEAK
jgi:FKBP-type peptidyl-prolyl cis-trans isomerase SlyD